MALTIGYHKIRGLGAPLRMMCYYKEEPFTNWACASDMKETWNEGLKTELIKVNSCANLPFIRDGDQVVTQSNTCLLYLGRKLKIDKEENFIRNHTVLDQVMDLRNALMLVVYPFGSAKTKEQFPDAAKTHIEGTATTNFAKLEGFCQGPFMCGAEPQSGDFHVFEMIDQHEDICASLGLPSVVEKFPKLKALHSAMKDDPKLAKYFAADCYTKYAQNNAAFTHFVGPGFAGQEYGTTIEEKVEFGQDGEPSRCQIS